LFRGGTEVVTIDASVRRRNAPVTGLTAHDFDLVDNGVSQTIELQTVDTVPIDVTLVFDEGSFSQAAIGSGYASGLARIAGLLRPIDRLRVIRFATDVREVSPIQHPSGWMKQGKGDSSQALATLLPLGRQDYGGYDRQHDPKLRWPSLFDALLLALAKPPEFGRRHLVIAFCVSVDKGSVLVDGTFFDAIAERTDALLHVALWNRREADYLKEGFRGLYVRRAVTAAAIATGGDVHDVADGVDAFEAIFDNFKQSYHLQYTVTGVPTGGWHAVTVKVPGFPTYDVQARKGYMGR
jgi:hypothetical protein